MSNMMFRTYTLGWYNILNIHVCVHVHCIHKQRIVEPIGIVTDFQNMQRHHFRMPHFRTNV